MTVVQTLDQFPVGMRVLAVDDNPTCLRILQTLLHHCQYHVTTTNQAQTALELLRENKNKFDLVISDVDMPDMDGFKLLELVGLEMDLPVIMVSAHSDREYVLKGVTHGACDYLVKPVRIEELKNIWQHVVRKSKLKKMKSSVVSNGESGGDSDQNIVKANRKRKDQYEEEEEEEKERGNENDDPTTQKKPRVVWTPELHKKFLVAVNHLGVEKAVPKRILDLMNDDTLTRENVASHLQKFRLALKKLDSEANQLANMTAFGSHFMQMSSPLQGISRLPVIGSGQTFHGMGMGHYSSNGNLGRLNSPAGMFSTPLPLNNHNNEANILRGFQKSPLEDLHISYNNNKAFPNCFTPSQQQSALMVAPNNHLVLESSRPGFPPHFEINKRPQHWSNDVHSKPEALEWNFLANPTAFCRNTDFGAEFLDPIQQQQPGNNLVGGPMTGAQLLTDNNNSTKEGFIMAEQKLQSGFMASDAVDSIDDLVNSLMTQEHSPVDDFSGGDLGFEGFSFLGTCI